MASLLTALELATLLQSPPPAQPQPDVIALAQAVLESIVANDFTKVEEHFTGDVRGGPRA
jgi:hypothetical protein